MRPLNPLLARRTSAAGAVRSLRFFFGLKETAGFHERLAVGMRGLGHRATTADLSGHPFHYSTSDGWWTSAARALGRKRREPGIVPLRIVVLLQQCLAALVLIWAIPRHDVFVIGGMSRWPTIMICGVVRLAGRRTVVVLHGTDSRPPYLDGFHAAARGGDIAGLIRATRRQQESVRAMEKWADCIVSHTASSHFLRKPFVSFLWLGIPALPTNISTEPRTTDRLRVVHAPSHPEGKGTSHVRRAVAELTAEGVGIEYTELIGVTNMRVLQELARCDVLVDQVFSDQPMPGLATEAASYGVPTIIGGYEWDAVRTENALVPWPPTIQVHPRGIKAALRAIASDGAARELDGTQARAYVESRLMPRAVAHRLVEVALNTAPPEAFVSPLDIRAIHGCGQDLMRSMALIHRMVEEAGPASLCVDDKPRLRQRLLERALGPTQ